MKGLKDKVVIVTGGAGGIGAAAHGRAYAVDIADQARVVAAVEKVERELGPVDVLVNNAGWHRAAPFLQTDRDLWQKIVAINLMGPINMHHAVLQGMKTRGRGRVVNVASDAGRVGSSGEAVYSACKGGIIAFTKPMAREMASRQINLNVVCPGSSPRTTPPSSPGRCCRSRVDRPWPAEVEFASRAADRPGG